MWSQGGRGDASHVAQHLYSINDSSPLKPHRSKSGYVRAQFDVTGSQIGADAALFLTSSDNSGFKWRLPAKVTPPWRNVAWEEAREREFTEVRHL